MLIEARRTGRAQALLLASMARRLARAGVTQRDGGVVETLLDAP
jgi:hypothetical protein